MRALNLIIVLGLSAIFFIAGASNSVRAKEHIIKLELINGALKKLDSVDICSGSTKFLLSLRLDSLTLQDSIYGYEFFLKYNREKLKYMQTIKSSLTMSGIFEDVEFSSSSSNDTVFCNGAIARQGFYLYSDSVKLNDSLTLNKPLVVIEFKYLDSMPYIDSNMFWLLFRKIGHDFTGDYLKYENLKFISKVFNLPERVINSDFKNDSIVFENDTIKSKQTTLDISFNENLSFTSFIIEFDSLEYSSIDSIKTKSDKFVLDSIFENKYYFTYLDANKKYNGSFLDIYLTRLSDSLNFEKLKYKISNNTIKTCVSELLSDSIEIKYKKIETVSVEDNKIENFRIILKDKRLILDGSLDGNSIEIYDVLGNKIYSNDKVLNEIDLSCLKSDIIAVIVRNNNKIIANKIFNLFFDQL